MINHLKLLLILSFGLLINCIHAQQHIESFMVEVPAQHIHYKLNGKKKSVDVSSFYIARLPESNEQYQHYLNKLDSIDLMDALPNRNQLRGQGLASSQIDFLVNEFYTSKDYYKYPIIGLSKAQIQEYLQWKTNFVGKSVLRENGIEFDSLLNYSEIIRQFNDPSSIPLQVEYTMAIEPILVSAHTYLSHSKTHKKNEVPTTGILKELGIEALSNYELGTTKRIDELIFTQRKKRTSWEDGIVTPIKGKNYKKLKMGVEDENMLKPFRVWHIKI
ncbi:MAG: hypothetical protein P1U56_20960 [Saprospiraceae bacterium]|nr:hypothetical protein [Saprospiraceae bacterium]